MTCMQLIYIPRIRLSKQHNYPCFIALFALRHRCVYVCIGCFDSNLFSLTVMQIMKMFTTRSNHHRIHSTSSETIRRNGYLACINIQIELFTTSQTENANKHIKITSLGVTGLNKYFITMFFMYCFLHDEE